MTLTTPSMGGVPRTPETEAQAKALAMTALLLLQTFSHGPNTQALVSRAFVILNDPDNWNALLNVLLGPPPAPVPKVSTDQP